MSESRHFAGAGLLALALLLVILGSLAVSRIEWPKSTPATQRIVAAKRQGTMTIQQPMWIGKVMVMIPQFIPVYTLTATDGAKAKVDGGDYDKAAVGKPFSAKWHLSD